MGSNSHAYLFARGAPRIGSRETRIVVFVAIEKKELVDAPIFLPL
jgi:hypothetical protein